MGPNWPTGSERELLADAGRRSFRIFVKHVIGLPRSPLGKWWDDSIHDPWCDWLQAEVEAWEQSGVRRCLMINAHRGSGKTMLVTKCLSLWLHLRDPNRAGTICAIDQTMATEFASFCRNVLSGADPYSYFAWLYGSWEGSHWTQDRFTHSKRQVNRTDPSYRIASVETGITGSHPDFLIGDDWTNYQKVREQGNWIGITKKLLASCFPALLKHSLFIYVGTPYTDNDVMIGTIRRDGVGVVVGEPLPKDYARYHRKDGLWRMYHLPGVREDGSIVLPKSWTQEDLDRYRRNEPGEYASQIQLCPGSGDLSPLTFAQIEECVVSPAEVPRGMPVSIHLDTAFKSSKRMGTGDWSAIIVAGHYRPLADVYYLEEHGSQSWRDDNFIAKLIEIVRSLYERKVSVLAITDEKEIGGKEGLWHKRLISAFRDEGMRMPRFMQFRRGSGDDNTSRISTAAGYWMEGHVKIARGRCPNLIEQMARIGMSEHDDFASAAADAFHPELYQVFHGMHAREAPIARRAQEEVLSGANITAAYDRWNRLVKNRPRPPIR